MIVRGGGGQGHRVCARSHIMVNLFVSQSAEKKPQTKDLEAHSAWNQDLIWPDGTETQKDRTSLVFCSCAESEKKVRPACDQIALQEIAICVAAQVNGFYVAKINCETNSERTRCQTQGPDDQVALSKHARAEKQTNTRAEKKHTSSRKTKHQQQIDNRKCCICAKQQHWHANKSRAKYSASSWTDTLHSRTYYLSSVFAPVVKNPAQES